MAEIEVKTEAQDKPVVHTPTAHETLMRVTCQCAVVELKVENACSKGCKEKREKRMRREKSKNLLLLLLLLPDF